MTLSPKYERMFDELLATVASDHHPAEKLAVFWPTCGHDYGSRSPRLMVVGRAVNGWGDGVPSDSLSTPNARAAAISKTRSRSEDEHQCPMHWVEELAGGPKHNTNRSAFWRVIRAVTSKAYSWPDPPAPGWTRVLSWSNLFKLSPEGRGNPSTKLRRLITQTSARLLRQEVEEFAPEAVLVLAGLDWFSLFADVLGLRPSGRGGPVEATGTTGSTRWVIAKHPERKPEQPATQAITEALMG